MTRDIGKSHLVKNSIAQWVWHGLITLVTIAVLVMYFNQLNVYEISILILSSVIISFLGQDWSGFRRHCIVVTALSLLAIQQYGNDLTLADSTFLLSYMLASQTAFMWMSALFIMATVAYFGGLLIRSHFTTYVGTALTWSAITMGMVGLLVRWKESYLIGANVGHIPVSNLYEVFILFTVITGLVYLYYERRYRINTLGGFILLVISAAVVFQLWYIFERNAHEIQPLVPALQSYWMKIHVPANFIGYGTFAMAAMVGVAYLLTSWLQTNQPTARLIDSMPSLALMDELMYKAISLGFALFTVATILGALWAAEAWGGYWSWDPKETWALIVWLNYAAWLHMRMTKGWGGRLMAWWAVIGLFITLFAFLGVNIFLSGLHSYGML